LGLFGGASKKIRVADAGPDCWRDVDVDGSRGFVLTPLDDARQQSSAREEGYEQQSAPIRALRAGLFDASFAPGRWDERLARLQPRRAVQLAERLTFIGGVA